MIACISCDNIHLHGQAIRSQYLLRHRAFVERQSYKVFSYNNMEYDQYDNPSAVYLVYQNEYGEALGVSRLTPISHRSMLQDLFPEMVDDHSIFTSSCMWEGTRFCVEKNIPSSLRLKVVQELVGAYFEFGFNEKIEAIVGMMPTYILKSVFKNNGCEYEPLGPSKLIDGQTIQAAKMAINQQNLMSFQKKSGVEFPVISSFNQDYQKVA